MQQNDDDDGDDDDDQMMMMMMMMIHFGTPFIQWLHNWNKILLEDLIKHL